MHRHIHLHDFWIGFSSKLAGNPHERNKAITAKISSLELRKILMKARRQWNLPLIA
jgi:hypothetical protein